MSANGKPKFAMYWAAGSGGCEVEEIRALGPLNWPEKRNGAMHTQPAVSQSMEVEHHERER